MTKPKPPNPCHTLRTCSRKRSRYAKVCLAPFVLTAFGSKMPQHRVGRAQRIVTYQHLIEDNILREPRSKFWHPAMPDDDRSRPRSSQSGNRGLLSRIRDSSETIKELRTEPGDIHWTMVVDAGSDPNENSKLNSGSEWTSRLEAQQKLENEETDENGRRAQSIGFDKYADDQRNNPTAQLQSSRNEERSELMPRNQHVENNELVSKTNHESNTNTMETVAAIPTLNETYDNTNTIVYSFENLTLSNTSYYNQVVNFTTDIYYDVASTVTTENDTLTNETVTNSSNTTIMYDSFNETFGESTTQSDSKFSLFRPLRLRAILSEQLGGAIHLNITQRNYLLHEIIRPALLLWSGALRVDPVIGNLTVDKTQLYDGVSCGPGLSSGHPSIPVPPSHLTEGMPDTDMLVYLNLGFANFAVFEEMKIKTGNTTATASESATTPAGATGAASQPPGSNKKAEYGSTTGYHNPQGERQRARRLSGTAEAPTGSYTPEDRVYSALHDPTSSAVYPPTPVVPANKSEEIYGSRERIYNTSDYSYNSTHISQNRTNFTGYSVPQEPLVEPPKCSGDYLAAAAFCSTDQYDRPTAAILHLCIDEGFFDKKNLDRNIVTVMHELGHALGLNSRSIAHFRKGDGTPMTPRGANGEIPETEVECTGPQGGRRWANISLPSEDILKFRTVRGGVRVAEIVTPSVLQVARNHFDCQSLTGAELESGEYMPLTGNNSEGETSCIGDHWERRLFRDDLMNPVVSGVEFSPYISTITLAYFADSGWYQVDLSRAEPAASWGRGAGCSFVEETCIGDDGQVSPSNDAFFCNVAPRISSMGVVEDIHGCTPDFLRKAACSLGQYDLELPPEYQYFNHTYGSKVGGIDPFIDYCPVYTGFSNGLCSQSENEALLKVNNIERFGKRNSRCLAGLMETQRTALCLPIACVVEDRSLHVQIDGRWHVCEHEDQNLHLWGDEWVVCPDPRRVCPTFYCHRDCLGTSRRCDYATGKCVCDSNRTTLIGLEESLQARSGNDYNNTKYDDNCNVISSTEPKDKTFYGIITDDHDLPSADSPLSDYYVPSKEFLLLKEPESLNSHRKPAWQVPVIGVTVFVICIIFLFFCCRGTVLRAFMKGGENGNDGPGGETTLNPNKDKMIASIVVDMRMNDHRLRERDGSQTELISNGETDEFDRASMRSEFSSGLHSLVESIDERETSTLGEEQPQNQQELLADDILIEPSLSAVRRRNPSHI